MFITEHTIKLHTGLHWTKFFISICNACATRMEFNKKIILRNALRRI